MLETKKPLQSRSDVKLTFVKTFFVSDLYVWKQCWLAAWRGKTSLWDLKKRTTDEHFAFIDHTTQKFKGNDFPNKKEPLHQKIRKA